MYEVQGKEVTSSILLFLPHNYAIQQQQLVTLKFWQIKEL